MCKKLQRITTKFRKNRRYHLLEVTKVKYVSEFIYQLTFNNKVVKSFDFKDYLDKTNERQAFFSLKNDMELFRNAIVENGTLTWNVSLI